MKRIALVLCAVLAFGAGVVAAAQGTSVPSAGAAGVVGTAAAVDETALAIGDKAAAASGGAATAGPNTLAYFIRMVVVLALVLGAIYGVYRLMRRLAKPKESAESAVKLLASTNLGAGKALHVVGMGSKAYLLGATEASISLIAEVEDKEFLDALSLKAALAPERGAARGDFAELLGSLLGKSRGRSRGSGRGAVEMGSGGDFIAQQRERLKKF